MCLGLGLGLESGLGGLGLALHVEPRRGLPEAPATYNPTPNQIGLPEARLRRRGESPVEAADLVRDRVGVRVQVGLGLGLGLGFGIR